MAVRTIGVGRISNKLSWLGLGDPGDRGTHPVTAITFHRAAIHLLAVYNLQCHQRPVRLIPGLYGWGG